MRFREPRHQGNFIYVLFEDTSKVQRSSRYFADANFVPYIVAVMWIEHAHMDRNWLTNGRGNLVPRSLVDEAEGEIWQSKKICFS